MNYRFSFIFIFLVFNISKAFCQDTAVDSFVRQKMEQYKIPGLSLAVMKGDQLVHLKSYGYSNLELKTRAQTGTSYLIGSVTKTFTAVAAMILWERKYFELEDSIGQYLPGLPSHWKKITIRQLLQHTSGIPTNLEKADSFCKFNYDPENYSQQNVLQETSCLPLEFSPGTKWEYSGRNYFIIGLLIEKLTGTSFEEFLRKEITGPLQMNETGMMNYRKLVPERADGYLWQEGTLINSKEMNVVVEFTDGGMMSTVPDLCKWMNALSHNKLIRASTRELMWTTTRLNDGREIPYYGIGFGLTPYKNHKRAGHTGNIPGFSSCINYYPDDDLSLVLLSNLFDPSFNVGLLGNEIAALFFTK